MTITLTDAHKRDISKTLHDVDPATVAEAAVLWAANWGMTDGADGTDTTEEGAARLVSAQRALSDLTDAIWSGVEDGSITATAKKRGRELSLADTYGQWLTPAERVEFGID